MIGSVLYNYYFRDLALDYRFKIAKGILLSFICYYWIHYQIKELVYWVICIDFFILGILVSKHKDLKLCTYLSKFGQDYFGISHPAEVKELDSMDVNSKKVLVI